MEHKDAAQTHDRKSEKRPAERQVAVDPGRRIRPRRDREDPARRARRQIGTAGNRHRSLRSAARRREAAAAEARTRQRPHAQKRQIRVRSRPKEPKDPAAAARFARRIPRAQARAAPECVASGAVAPGPSRGVATQRGATFRGRAQGSAHQRTRRAFRRRQEGGPNQGAPARQLARLIIETPRSERRQEVPHSLPENI